MVVETKGHKLYNELPDNRWQLIENEIKQSQIQESNVS